MNDNAPHFETEQERNEYIDKKIVFPDPENNGAMISLHDHNNRVNARRDAFAVVEGNGG